MTDFHRSHKKKAFVLFYLLVWERGTRMWERHTKLACVTEGQPANTNQMTGLHCEVSCWFLPTVSVQLDKKKKKTSSEGSLLLVAFNCDAVFLL